MFATDCSLATSGLTAWGLLAAVCAHECEEFVWPGGFRAWYIRHSPHVERSTAFASMDPLGAAHRLRAGVIRASSR